jgi:N-acetyl-alpha-D-glucosaminyl L-malate synthase BshA
MNIGITCYPTVGGSGAVAAELAKELARRGHTIHVIGHRVPFRLERYTDRIAFHQAETMSHVLFEQPPQDLALAAKMAEVAREHRLDIFHVHYAIPHAITAFLAAQMLGPGAPKIVTTLHGTDITLVGQDRSFFEITRFAIERSDAVTAVSEFLRKMTIDEFAPRKVVEVIPNFIDVAAYAQPLPTNGPDRGRKQPGQRVLLHLSNFRPVKRVTDVVRVFERVAARVPSVVLWMAGEGPERAAAEALSRRLGLRDRVHFIGVTDSIREIAASADVFILPSELESFGLASLEAMACGVPVISTDVGGTPEVVRHGVTGFLAPVGDVEQMAARTTELLLDETLRRALGAAGRAQAARLFDSKDVVGRYERLYARLLDA